MTANQLKHQTKLKEWTEAIQACRTSGLSVDAWCTQYGTTTTTYYRWEREILAGVKRKQNGQKGLTSATFAELPQLSVMQDFSPAITSAAMNAAMSCVATVRVNEFAIDVYPGADKELLKTLLEVMRSC